MSLLKLAKQTLLFYWRTNIGVLLCVVVSTAVLSGALLIGDSVRYTLGKLTDERLGPTRFAIAPQGKFISTKLSDNLAKELETRTAPVLQIKGIISKSGTEKGVNLIQVLGVDERFYKFSSSRIPFREGTENSIVLNKPLAERLNIKIGDYVVLRIENPSFMPRDIPLTPGSDLSAAFNLEVVAIVGDTDFGRFSLQANQTRPLNAFVQLQWLQDKLHRSGLANIILISDNGKKNITIEKSDAAIRNSWQLEDTELELRKYDSKGVFELRSRNVFIDSFLSMAALNSDNESIGIFTYFVNEIRLGDKAAPYSMVSAIRSYSGSGSIVSKNMKDDEIIINQWLADDLGAKTGDMLELKYFVLTSMRNLEEKSSSFRVSQILPMQGAAIDPNLMPDFPGLYDVDNCRDWKPGIDIDLNKIRDKDEKYWNDYKGTPKAFVTLNAGRKMWLNRYGNLTAVRYPINNHTENEIAAGILSIVTPSSVGLFFSPVRELGVRAGSGATDFGQLFLGLSMFLIIAALIFTGLVFIFGIEKRSEQIGILLAVGFRPELVKKLFLAEGLILAVLGAAIGTFVSVLYTKTVIYGLNTIWQSVISGSQILFHAKHATLLVGAIDSVICSLLTLWLTVRRSLKRPARELLSGALRWQYFKAKKASSGRAGFWAAAILLICAILIVALSGDSSSKSVSGAFFGAGSLLLLSGLSLNYALLKMISGRWNSAVSSLVGLGLRNSARRSGRSLAVIGLLACGIFLVIAVGANKQSPSDVRNRNSGTGGFALYGESTISVLYDLNSESGRKSMNLDNSSFNGIEVVQLRVHDGDDASCLNLNRAQTPRILGVQPRLLQQRNAFGFRQVIKDADKKDAWLLLEKSLTDSTFPVVGDYATVVWALGKSVGDDIDYLDEKGKKVHLRIVGIMNDSITQGSLIISEENFIKLFPSDEGYREFFIDAAQNNSANFSDMLMSRLRNFGMELTPASQRLAQFMVVENTYLSIFLLLGGLGMILGSIGLGMAVLRNVLDRRGELAMLQAVGYNKATLKKLIFHEHSILMLYGLLCGITAALIAVSPVLRTTSAHVPYLTIAAIVISAALWIWIAAGIALRGSFIDALRNE